MHELQELVDVVTCNKVKSIRLLEPFGDQPPDMLHDFYARLPNHDFANDEDAAQFYGYTSASDRAYRKQRDKLRERLYNSSVFIDVNNPKFNDSQKAHYSCFRNLIIIKTLLGRAARKSAIGLIKKTLKFSVKFEVSDVSLELYRLLKTHHASKTGNKTKYIKYRKLVNQYKTIVEDEILALDHFDHLSLYLVKNTYATNEYLQYAKNAITGLQKKSTNSYRFLLISRTIICNYYLHSRDYKMLIKEASYAYNALKEKAHVSDQFSGQFKFLQLLGYIQLSMSTEVRSTFSICKKLLEKGTVRWYNTYDQYMVYLFRNKIYQDLYQNYSTVVNESTFKLQTQKRRETWKTYEAYIYYLLISGKVDIDNGMSSLRFSINKFLNEVSMFSMDKGGYNIPIVVIQNLLLIRLKKHQELIGRIAAVEKYSKRHIKKSNNFRSHYFFKMLLLVPKFNFDRDVIEAKAKPYLKKLESVPLSEAKQSFEIEIIPYETLWEYVLESLD